MARRTVPPLRGEAETGDSVLSFLAEKLIALAAGAAFVIAPASLLLSGSGLPGTYGSATAIALAHVAIPFLALGWLSTSRNAWKAGIFALASWSALAGALVAVSPVLALTSGAVLFLVAGANGTVRRVEALMQTRTAPQPQADATPEQQQRGTVLELARDGRIRHRAGGLADKFRVGDSFVDHVHIADRIAFMGTMASMTDKSGGQTELSVRIDLSDAGEPQAFRTMQIDFAADGGSVRIGLREPAAETAEDPAGAEKRFLATVSHELRTPLNSIIGFSDILRRDFFGPLASERHREYVNLIHSSGVHLLSVVNTILDVSKLNSGTYSIYREPFELNGVVRECVSMLRPQADAKQVSVELDMAETMPEADADRRAIKQIAINLLSNAIKFTDAGGVIRVATERRENGFALSVRDSGIGMSNDDLARIGAPFSQIDNSYTRNCEGTGLGLTVVTGLVRLHGGSLEVKSEPGKGTEVIAIIPRASDIDNMETPGDDDRPAKPGEERKAHAGGDAGRLNGNMVRLAG